MSHRKRPFENYYGPRVYPIPESWRIYEDMSFENLVGFFREELEKIREGVSPFDVLNAGQVRKLTKRGVLEIVYDPYRQCIVTDKALEILEG